jgi:RNA polymerase sigma-70 factor (ECF subfamily)
VTLKPAAIAELYRSHGQVVLRRARLLLGSEADAQEALQEVFAALVQEPGTLRSTKSIVAWLYQATTHHCLNQLRKTRTGARILELHVAPSLASVGGPQGEAASDVRRLMTLLPDTVAAAVIYHHLDGMTHAEVAGLLGCSRRQVGYLLERAHNLWNHAEKTA